MNSSLKAIGVALLASVVTVWTTACSNDLPTDAAEKVGADAVQNQVAPTNDDFAAAEVIPSIPFTDTKDTREATTAPDDPNCVNDGATVWYQFTPTSTIRINANTFGSNYDTGLSVYIGTPADLTQIACNDDAGGTLQSSVTFEAEAGTTYFFMVGAFFQGLGGDLVFNVVVAPPPLEVDLTIDPVGSVNGATGVATIRGTVTCSRPALVEVSGELRQRKGRLFIFASFFSFIECDGVTSWEAETVSQNGLLVGGRAEVSAFAAFFDSATGEVVFAEESAIVRLRGKGK